ILWMLSAIPSGILESVWIASAEGGRPGAAARGRHAMTPMPPVGVDQRQSDRATAVDGARWCAGERRAEYREGEIDAKDGFTGRSPGPGGGNLRRRRHARSVRRPGP